MEDKDFYNVQINSKGQVGYSTWKQAAKETIHPSKRIKVIVPSTSNLYDLAEISSNTSISESHLSDDEEYFAHDIIDLSDMKKRKHSTRSARKLVRYGKLSTNKAATVCKILDEENVQIPIPSQSGIYKAVYKEAQKLEEIYIYK